MTPIRARFRPCGFHPSRTPLPLSRIFPSSGGIFPLGEPLYPTQKRAVRVAGGHFAPAPLSILREQRLPIPARRNRAQLHENRVGWLVDSASRDRRRIERARPTRFSLQHPVALIARRRFRQGEFDLRERLAFADALITDEESALLAVLVDFIDGGGNDALFQLAPIWIGILRNFEPASRNPGLASNSLCDTVRPNTKSR